LPQPGGTQVPRILIIDDDVETAENNAAILRRAGHDTSVYHSTTDALDVLQRDPPDLLILDVMFPENPMGGMDLARLVRRTRAIKRLPILLLSAVNRDFPANISEKDIDPEWLPVQAFAEKPLPPARLLTIVQELLSQSKAQ
jgi:CheY-like chemotaxis protein